MALTFSVSVILGLSFSIFLILLGYYWTVLRHIKGFPTYHGLFILIKYYLTRNKDTVFTNYAFQAMINNCRKYMKEGLCMTYILRPMLFIYGEETLKVFSNEKLAGEKSETMYQYLQDLLGAGLITSNGEKWKTHRKILNPAFNMEMLKDRVPLFNEHAAALVKDLKTLVGKPSANPLDLIRCHYFNALSESVFGFKQSEENMSKNLKYFYSFTNLAESTVFRIIHPWFTWKFMLNIFSHGREILQDFKEMDKFTKNMILDMKKHMTSNEISDTEYYSKNVHKSVAYILLQQHLNDSSFTFEDLQGEVNTFINVGYENVSYTTMWCLFLLGLHPEEQEKAYNEVKSVPDDYISLDDCSNFTYLESVIQETLRLYPTIPIISRKITQDVQYQNYKISKDTAIIFFIYLLHRNPYIYPDPEKFDPERFLGNREKRRWLHIPFSEGHRSCIGKRYAVIEMKIFLAHILRNFKITSLDRKEDVSVCWNVVLTPVKPFRMRMEPRLK